MQQSLTSREFSRVLGISFSALRNLVRAIPPDLRGRCRREGDRWDAFTVFGTKLVRELAAKYNLPAASRVAAHKLLMQLGEQGLHAATSRGAAHLMFGPTGCPCPVLVSRPWAEDAARKLGMVCVAVDVADAWKHFGTLLASIRSETAESEKVAAAAPHN